ncbi:MULTISPECIES: response regulator [Paraburkholderia]|uniref:response regulator n=1 Tax=Paraburkholderia TaxID=1822464 RepID=UPI00034920E4|nr:MULTISPECIES: response regulator [Paraburkholderia]WEY39452.1 response regulator [Paraburkholderia sp. SUR17]
MTADTIKPFFFPTTVGFVDDSAAFLSNLSLQLGSQLAFRLFNSPVQALRSLNDKPSPSEAGGRFVEPFFEPYRDRTDEDDTHHVIAMSLEAIRQQVHNGRRFARTSVVVVDYDMPEMNGLEFCRRIANPAVRKIILTGKANEHLAVKSFNEGLIDRFIRKQDSEAIATLNQAVEDMQNAYFEKACGTVLDTLAVTEYAFLKDTLFAAKVDEIFHRLNIVEHYLSYQPNGLLMLDSAGAAYLLIVHTDETLRGVREIAIEQQAPADFIAELDGRRSLPYFWETEGYYPARCSNWQRYMHPASAFEGERSYVYAVVKQPPGFNLSSIVPYDNYLESLDEEIRAAWGSSL